MKCDHASPERKSSMKKLAVVMSLCSTLACADAQAWGDQGHKAVGAIADQLIKNTNAQKHVDALLQPGENLAQASVWADCAKGQFCGPQTPEMIEFTSANPKHADYHFTNVPFQNAEYRDGGVGTRDIDIVHTLKQAIAVLQGKTGEADNPHHFTPRQALRLVAHLVGDIHQPLHVGEAYIGKEGKFVVPHDQAQVDGVNVFNTQGGNNLLLEDRKFWPARDVQASADPGADKAKFLARSLHLYWDVTVVEDLMRRLNTAMPEELAQIAVARNPKFTPNTGDPASWPYQWANESLAAAKPAYGELTIGTRIEQLSRKGDTYYAWFVTAPGLYTTAGSLAAENQIIKGGYHLAALLKAIWP
jgi:hypothetical protein